MTTLLLTEFNTVCKNIKLKATAGKRKVMVCAKTEGRDRLNLSLNGEMLEEVDSVTLSNTLDPSLARMEGSSKM